MKQHNNWRRCLVAKGGVEEFLASGGEITALPYRGRPQPVKGEEKDNVVLFTDIERIIYESAKRNADPEHRTFYVGVTRAKQKLFIANQGYEYQYNIGAPII